MLNAKRKGNTGEHNFSRWLVSNGIKAHRNVMSGGSIWKGDIANDLNLTIEVKTVKRINLQNAWKQVIRDSKLASSTPTLVVKFDGMPEDRFLVVIDNYDWLDLIRKTPEEKIVIEQATDSREKKWAIQNTITSLKKLLKFYE